MGHEKLEIIFRNITLEDAKEVAELERKCFPKTEAADLKAFIDRIGAYGNHFLCAEYEGKIVGLVDGLVTDDKDLKDEMYEDVSFHNENGCWQMIFGVETDPDFQGKGIASQALERFIEIAREENRKGLVLTCKEKLISFYQRFGFKNEGISGSKHGGVSWYQMRLSFFL